MRIAIVTIGHEVVMLTAKISELKANLSAYLAAVRRGGSVVIYDRTTPIATLAPLDEDDGLVIGEALDASRTLRSLKGVRPKVKIAVDAMLADLRRDR